MIVYAYEGRRNLDADHIKWLLSKPRQKQEQEYAYHLKLARGYRWQAESLFGQGQRKLAALALGFAQSEIATARAVRLGVDQEDSAP